MCIKDRYEAERRTIVGEVKVMFEPFARVLLPAQQTMLQSELGKVAEYLLNGNDEGATDLAAKADGEPDDKPPLPSMQLHILADTQPATHNKDDEDGVYVI
eukprot:TRINITY_DN49930_c0_g1_i1.p2 TRINITY_DN49930_c0_g1~~TRINITY_DN49930_c0_g1_i1.p2  ORF type:complete len:101 (+),score=32.29 TRINITY_DN49930_c0_g1_i1:114-416(+)